jgi:hypothetical protein
MALFLPGDTIVLTVSTTSARVPIPYQGGNVRLVNDSGENAWVEWGDAAVVASPTGSPLMLPGTVWTCRMPPRATHIAALLGGGKNSTGSLNITFGEGT